MGPDEGEVVEARGSGACTLYPGSRRVIPMYITFVCM